MLSILLSWYAAFLVILAAGNPACNTWTTCDSCVRADAWAPTRKCSWCPVDNECHEFGSMVNPCSLSQLVHKPKECKGPAPTPPPPTPPDVNSTKFVQQVLVFLFKHLEITDVDPAACASDIAGATLLFRDFSTDIVSLSYRLALTDLSRAFSALSRSVNGCGVQELQQKIDTLARSVKFANISTENFDKDVKILVDASDLWDHLKAVGDAVNSNDPGAVGQKLGELLDAWTSVTGGCKDGDKGCKLLDGLLRVLGVAAKDVRPCVVSMMPAVENFTDAAKAFDEKDYKSAVASFALGLDFVAKVASSDTCGLKALADAIGDLGTKLKSAEVFLEHSKLAKIVVGSADVYPELYALVVDLKKEDFAGAGLQIGALLTQLRASGCESRACVAVEGLLSVLQIGLPDLTSCHKALDTTWDSFELFLRSLRMKQWHDSLNNLGTVFEQLSPMMKDCGVSDIASSLEDSAKQLHDDSFANEIGIVVQFLANGADVSSDMQKIIADFEANDWAALGRDLGSLSDWIASKTDCHSFMCRLTEGILKEASLALPDLRPCEAKLREGDSYFTSGVAIWSRGDEQSAVKSWAAGLNSLSQAVAGCGLEEQLGWIAQEANVFGLGNLSADIKGMKSLLVHGSDFYEDVFGAVQDFQNHDYRAAAGKLSKIMDALSQWTRGHLCTSPICYIVNGIMQMVVELQQDFGKCKSDFIDAWDKFGSGFEELAGNKSSAIWFFSNTTQNISQGVKDIGLGLQDVANGVGDCHLGPLKIILDHLAEKLLLSPEITWLDAFLKIVIDGVQIEGELADACKDFSQKDWAGFGYNVAKLMKTLIKDGAAKTVIVI